MFAILSMLFIIFLYDSKLSNIVLNSPVEQKDYYKVYLHFSIFQLALVVINNTINYLIFKILPDSLIAILFISTLLISTGYSIILKMFFKKFSIAEYFNSNSLFYLLLISGILQLRFNAGLLGTVLTTVLSGIGFLIIGIILISILNHTDKYRFGKISFIMILSSIILMIITIV